MKPSPRRLTPCRRSNHSCAARAHTSTASGTFLAGTFRGQSKGVRNSRGD
jgi:hypothetical protein